MQISCEKQNVSSCGYKYAGGKQHFLCFILCLSKSSMQQNRRRGVKAKNLTKNMFLC